ncbi:MAG: ABC transporter substrate-binding protein [Lachnospiraceae bacterium]|nr:ABC transporter substrate-binding protein [Lachnospiraceae bacterium]
MKKAIVSVLLTAALLTSGMSVMAEEDTIKIGALFNLTGGQASIDTPSYQGFKLKADEINAAGGINGRMIEVVSYDGKTDQATCANNAKKMIDVDNCVVISGFSDSNYALAAGAITQEKQVPFVITGATLPDLCEQIGDYSFMIPFGDDTCAYAAAEYAYAELGTKCYLLIDQSMEFTKTLAECFQERFEELGGEIVATDNYMNGDPDFSAQIDKFTNNDGGAEFMFFSGVPDDAGPLVLQYRDKGVELPIVSGDGFDTPLIAEVAGDQAHDVYVSTHCSYTNEAENIQNFVAAYTEAYGTAPENAFAGLGYDAMDLIGQALATVEDPTDTAAIKDAIEATTEFKGVTGTISYTADSHKPDKTASILELSDGEFHFVTEE